MRARGIYKFSRVEPTSQLISYKFEGKCIYQRRIHGVARNNSVIDTVLNRKEKTVIYGDKWLQDRVGYVKLSFIDRYLSII